MKKINLSQEEKDFLRGFVKNGKKQAMEVVRAYILLLVNKNKTEKEIKEILEISRATVSNIKKRYREGGLERALHDKQRSGQPKKYKAEHEAGVIALACTDPPRGKKRWSVRLITKTLKRKEKFKSLNRESVRLILKKAGLNLG